MDNTELKFDPKGHWQKYYERCAQAKYQFDHNYCSFETYLKLMKDARTSLRLAIGS